MALRRKFLAPSSAQKEGLRRLVTRFNGTRAPELIRGCELPFRVLVGTHHKTGTVWLESVFRAAGDFHGLTHFSGEQCDLPDRWDIFFQDHSDFDMDALRESDERPIRGIHLVRDPRDIVVSGCFYHQKSHEAWLHEPMTELDGRTYQTAIKSIADPGDRLMFELEHSGRATIEEILAWNYTGDDFLELKYEDLIRDTDLELFHLLFTFLGFPGAVLSSLLGFAWQNSLFSGRHDRSTHIRSGHGAQWSRHFNKTHRLRFLELFGDALVRLGYEEDNDWVEQEPV